MAEPSVRLLEKDEAASWPASLSSAGGFVALDAWSHFLREVYGIDYYRLEASKEGDVTGLLVLNHIKHPIFGEYLTTAPFASYGGFAYQSIEVREALLREARTLVQSLDADYGLVRFSEMVKNLPSGWTAEPNYATYLVDLMEPAEAMLSSFSQDHRNHIRRSMRRGFTIQFGQIELLDDVYHILAQSMHELGSPYHSKKYLRAMARSLGSKLEFALVYDAGGKPAGAGVFIQHGETMTNLHANILKRHRPYYGGEFLYWSAILHCYEKGIRFFDLGRSLIGSGNEVFKMKWKPRRRELSYWHHLRKINEIPGINQKNPKFQLAIRTWQRLPGFLVRAFGPALIRGLA